MHDLGVIFEKLESCRDERVALVTLLSREGSSYRAPGARMLVTSSETFGVLSGGCIEAALVDAARETIRTGTPRVLALDTAKDAELPWSYGVGCPALLDFLIELVDPHRLPQPLSALREALHRGERSVLVTEIAASPRQWVVLRDEVVPPAMGAHVADAARHALQHGTSRLVVEDEARFFVEAIDRPVHLLLSGAGDNSLPLARFAQELGWRVTVVDRRPALVTRQRFPHAQQLLAAHADAVPDELLRSATAAVLLSHHDDTDRALLPRLLSTSIRYVGLLGSSRRCARLLEGRHDARVHGPVGLDIGADGPHEIALAITAEICAVLSGRAGGSLSGEGATSGELAHA